MFKIFGYHSHIDLENNLNKWMYENKDVKITDLKYKIVKEEDEFWHFVLIYYY